MEFKVTFLNCVSHGDCAIITFKEGRRKACIVVDGGKTISCSDALTDYLEGENVKTIDLLVGTHIDSDHIYGLYFFTRDQVESKEAGNDYIKIREFWGAQPSKSMLPEIDHVSYTSPTGSEDKFSWRRLVIQSVGQNDNLITNLGKLETDIKYPSLAEPVDNPFNNIDIELLAPDVQIPADTISKHALGITTRASTDKQIKIEDLESLKLAVHANMELLAEEAKRNANNQSIVIRLKPATGTNEAKKWTFLLTGDAEEKSWERMLGNPDTAPSLPARVIKIPHHGSVNGITEDGVKAVEPEYSVNSVGKDHPIPDKEPFQFLQAHGSVILCTQRNQSSKNKSDCYDIAAEFCPALDNPESITFVLDTDTGECTITPAARQCKYDWN